MGEAETTASVVMVDWADVELVRTTAAGHGVEVQVVETKGMDPLSTTTLVLVGVPLAVGTVTQLLDRLRGGQVIDLRPGAGKALYRTKDVVYGLIVIYAVDGQVSVEVKEPRGTFGEAVDVITKVLTGRGGAGAKDIAELVESTLGEIGNATVDEDELGA
jgi:hypothetical protein